MQQTLIPRARTLAPLILGLVAATLAGAAGAAPEPAHFRPGVVDVIDARDLLNEGAEIHKTFGETLQVTLSGTSLSRDFDKRPIEVRIYRLNDKGSGPASLFSILGGLLPCTVYYGTVYPVSPQGNILTIATFDDIHWLNVDGAGRLKPGRFRLVFQTRSDNHGLFRLSLKGGLSLDRYFKLGIDVVVATTYFPPDQVSAYAAQYHEAQSEEAKAAKIVAPDLTCYAARQDITVKGKTTFLTACGSGPRADPVRSADG